jgi:formamidopyrimidine-DNA glycosylase
MHRASVDPFELVADLLNRPGAWDRLVSEVTAVLQESISRKFTYLQELDKKGEEYKVFNNWLQVYGKGNSAKDRQGRTVWFSGGEGSEPRNAPFPAPVAGKSRKRSRSS